MYVDLEANQPGQEAFDLVNDEVQWKVSVRNMMPHASGTAGI